MFLLGYDIGSSSVKASLIDTGNSTTVFSDFSPQQEMVIHSEKIGWAEQDPETWWKYLVDVTRKVLDDSKVDPADIKGIGISWQMHGLVCVDKNHHVLRPSIIWCDSRAVPYGNDAFDKLGKEQSLSYLLNSPGNFTAAKLAWVKENEPEVYSRIFKVMLPGDYIAMKLTGRITTTIGGLSEGVFWDFKKHRVSQDVMDCFGFDDSLIPEIVPTFGDQGSVCKSAALELGLEEGTKLGYRSGDQPNNALSLNVMEPGEVAATAGTSGVVYGVMDDYNYDPLSRINIFSHVNHSKERPRLGALLCVNGTGILNSWIKKELLFNRLSYQEMNSLADKSPIGANGISFVPFGNGAERMLLNNNIGASVHNISFNNHSMGDIIRAAQEGVVFSFRFGMDIMREIGLDLQVIKAGHSNMFLSEVFRKTLSSITGSVIEIFDTDGSIGAARGAGMGIGVYTNREEAFTSLERIMVVEPDLKNKEQYQEAYNKWKLKINN
ncbi:MAG TPA: FGGY family carbohydrate kinase [Candidatus Sphingobacterium stercoripullorum]|uniref:Carbohydrate kinase n=1 Tax=Candidatus Sphingobacterium stercoripullorum TaxID=2838759 RepID=A0A9D2AXW4_9SPHI|nr:carbohydrate kinase [Candidatus Sphingobacterium stercoripullorum]HLR49147.1 FGGY family carbohydrate kinase [Candidatus Sphingobacterium stercoripullorum]